jgi:hypothetical protein
MELRLDPARLAQLHLFVATPMYGGACHGAYAQACLGLQALAARHGLRTTFSYVFNESLIPRARNHLVDEFLRTDATHLLFVDADVRFEPFDALVLLGLDKEVVGAPYPKKGLRWDAVKKAVLAHPEIDPRELERVAGDYAFNPLPGRDRLPLGEPVEVMEAGTGFLLIARGVFEKLAAAHPTRRYHPDVLTADAGDRVDPSRWVHAHFDTTIDAPGSLVGEGTDRYLSEDYTFCRLWRKLGGAIWLCPWMELDHLGTHRYRGDLGAIARYVGGIGPHDP